MTSWVITLRSFAVMSLLLLGCTRARGPSVDPEARRLDPPVLIIEDPAAGSTEQTEVERLGSERMSSPIDSQTDVITFTGDDAEPGLVDEVRAPPRREPLPSMMSDILHGPNKGPG